MNRPTMYFSGFAQWPVFTRWLFLSPRLEKLLKVLDIYYEPFSRVDSCWAVKVLEETIPGPSLLQHLGLRNRLGFSETVKYRTLFSYVFSVKESACIEIDQTTLQLSYLFSASFLKSSLMVLTEPQKVEGSFGKCSLLTWWTLQASD